MGYLKSSRLVIFCASSILATLGFAQTGSAREYQIDQSHSSVGFVARHMMSKVPGSFVDFEGDFSFDSKNPEHGKVKATIKTSSVNTQNQKRDEHLRSGDFFDAKKHPSMTFTSSKISSDGSGKFKISGDLTLRGVTKPVVLETEFLGETDDPWGGHRAGFSATGKLNRKDFGMVWNKALDAGGVILGDEIEIMINVEGMEKKAKK